MCGVQLHAPYQGIATGVHCQQAHRLAITSCLISSHMPVDGFDTTVVSPVAEQSVELEDMAATDTDYRTAVDAPLLEQNVRRGINDDSDRLLLSSESRSYGGVFIWALTFSAGISGLLFGYEYV